MTRYTDNATSQLDNATPPSTTELDDETIRLNSENNVKRRPFSATRDNWKPEYTQILYWVQKNLPTPEIASRVGLGAITVTRVIASPYFRERLTRAQEAYELKRSNRLADLQATDPIQRKLEKAASKAATILVKALKGAKDVSRQQIFVAKDLLDRTGYKAKEKIEVDTYSHNYSPQEVSSAHTTLLEVQEILHSIGTRGTGYLISRSSLQSTAHTTPSTPSTHSTPPPEVETSTTDELSDEDFDAEIDP